MSSREGQGLGLILGSGLPGLSALLFALGNAPCMAGTVPTRASHTTVLFPTSPEAPWACPITPPPPPLPCPHLHLLLLRGSPAVPSGQKSRPLGLVWARIARSHSGARCSCSWSLLPSCFLFTTPCRPRIATPSGRGPEGLAWWLGASCSWKSWLTALAVFSGGGGLGLFCVF